MPASQAVYEALSLRLIGATTREEQDQLLDAWSNIRDCATTWDAVAWGFSEDWCTKERKLMETRIKSADRRKVS
jgi:hypothetical protein